MALTVGLISFSSFDDTVAVFYEYLQQFSGDPTEARKLIVMMRYVFLSLESPTRMEKSKQFLSTTLGNFARKGDLNPICWKTFGELLMAQTNLNIENEEYDAWRKFIIGLKVEVEIKGKDPLVIIFLDFIIISL